MVLKSENQLTCSHPGWVNNKYWRINFEECPHFKIFMFAIIPDVKQLNLYHEY